MSTVDAPVWVFRIPLPSVGHIQVPRHVFDKFSKDAREAITQLIGLRNTFKRALDAGVTESALDAAAIYLPKLLGAITLTDKMPAISVSWNMPLMPVEGTTLRFEYAMVLYAIAILRRQRASEHLRIATGNTDSPAFKACVAELQKAAGIFLFIATLPLGNTGLLELSSEFLANMTTFTLIEVSMLSVRKAGALATSRGVVAKLSHDIMRKAAATLAVFSKTPPMTYRVLDAMCWYLHLIEIAYRGILYYSVGVDNEKTAQPGVRAAYGMQIVIEERDSRHVRDALPEFVSQVFALLAVLKNIGELWIKQNEEIYFEPVPSDTAQLPIPEPATISKPELYTNPAADVITSCTTQ